MNQTLYELVLHVNSGIDRQRADTMLDSCDWTTYLKNPIKVQNNQKLKIEIESIEIPNTAYTFPSYESIFWWIKGYGTTNTLKSLALPIDRNFLNSTDLITYVNAQMVANSELLAFTYDPNTNKITITNNEAVAIRVVGSYRYNDTVSGTVYDNIADRFGFIADITTTSIAAGSTITGDGVLRLLRTNCYYLTTDILGGRYKQCNIPNPLDTFDVVARVSSSNYGAISQLRIGSSISYNVLDTIIHKIHFLLLDDQFEPVNLNGSPITFSAKFSVTN